MTESRDILIGMPGPSCTFATAQALMLASRQHHVFLQGSGGSWDNFNKLLCEALNLAQEGKISHFALLHADINPQDFWLDVLVAEAERLKVSYISAVAPIKDARGLTACGIGDPGNDWSPLRRFTMTEVLALPETFTERDAGYEDYPLLHNNGCCLLDLRDKRFFQLDGRGELECAWIFPKRVVRGPDGRFSVQGESEDWYLSRKMFEAGIPTALTRKVRLEHVGATRWPNDEAWGNAHDEEARFKWQDNPGAL